MTSTYARSAAAAAVAMSALCQSACSNEAAPIDPKGAPEMLALAPEETFEGKTLEEWAIEYARWYYSPTDCREFPTNDSDGSWCGNYQDPESPVFFFDRSELSEGATRRVTRTQCRVPAGKAILVPVASLIGDRAGMNMPLPNEEIEALLGDVKATMRKLKLSADGEEIEQLESAGLGPVRFSYRVPPTPNRYGCDDSRMVNDVEVEPSFLIGHFVLFQPPSVGWHELEYSSALTMYEHDFTFDVHSRFEVEELD